MSVAAPHRSNFGLPDPHSERRSWDRQISHRQQSCDELSSNTRIASCYHTPDPDGFERNTVQQPTLART
jgi:hypothetical protein